MNCKKITLSIFTAGMLLTGCGGGGGGTAASVSSGTTVLSGQVVDPVIKGAEVRLCLLDDNTQCESVVDVTDSNGNFSLNISGGLDLSKYAIISKNGEDAGTGMSFSGITLSSPANLNSSSHIVSPLTTMVKKQLDKNSSMNTTAALAKISADLGVGQESIKNDPIENAQAQKLAMMLSSIVKVGAKNFGDIIISNGDVESYITNEFTAQPEILNELNTTLSILNEQNSSIDAISSFASLQQLISSDAMSEHNKSNALVFENLKKLVNEVTQTLKEKGINSPNLSQITTVISLAGDHNLSDMNLTVSDINVSDVNLSGIVNNSNTVISSQIPLSTALGNDSTKKREYYYTSSVSHLNKAEDVIKNIYDVSVTDDIYLKLIEGYLNNNQLDRALEYIDSKVFKSVNKAIGYIKVAIQMNKTNTDAVKSKKLLDDAVELLKTAYQNKLLDNNAAKYFGLIYSEYGKLQLAAKLNEIDQYINGKVADFTVYTNWTSYLNGLRDLGEYQLENKLLDDAKVTVDRMFALAKTMPPYKKSSDPDNKAKWHHYTKLVYMSGIAKISVQLDNASVTEEIVDYMQALRLDDGIDENGVFGDSSDTGKKADPYVDDMAGYYVAVGKLEKAEAIIETIVNKTKTDYFDAAYKSVAYGLSKTDLNASLEVIDNNISDFGVKIETLTYFGTTRKATPLIGQDLIDQGDLATAKTVIDKATAILEDAVKNDLVESDSSVKAADKIKAKVLSYVYDGYATLAELYKVLGENDKSEELFDRGVSYLDNNISITDESSDNDKEYLVRGYIYLENYFNLAGDNTNAQLMLDKAVAAADSFSDLPSKTEAYNLILALMHHDSKDTELSVATKLYDITAVETDIGQSTEEKNKTKRVYYILKSAAAYGKYNDFTNVVKTMDKAVEIANSVLKESTKYDQYEDIITEYVNFDMIEEAVALANSVKYTYEKRELLSHIADIAADYDRFPEIEGISVDYDRDGKPDFYDYGYDENNVTVAIDDDVDGDGVLDSVDQTPFYNGND